MKIRQGIDIASVQRMGEAVRRGKSPFLRRIFTPAEQAYCEPKRRKFEHYAARFAAKEAFLKAAAIDRGKGFLFRRIEIRRHATGKPYIFLSASARKHFGLGDGVRIELSIAHERDFAIATVLIMSG